MTNAETAFRQLIRALAYLGEDMSIVPDSLACALVSHKDTQPWQVSLVIQPDPLGLRVCGHLPLYLDPHSADVEGILRRLNDLNRQPLAVSFSLDPLGGVAAFRAWLPLDSAAKSLHPMVNLALSLAADAALLARRHLDHTNLMFVSSPGPQEFTAPRWEDDIPF